MALPFGRADATLVHVETYSLLLAEKESMTTRRNRFLELHDKGELNTKFAFQLVEQCETKLADIDKTLMDYEFLAHVSTEQKAVIKLANQLIEDAHQLLNASLSDPEDARRKFAQVAGLSGSIWNNTAAAACQIELPDHDKPGTSKN